MTSHSARDDYSSLLPVDFERGSLLQVTPDNRPSSSSSMGRSRSFSSVSDAIAQAKDVIDEDVRSDADAGTSTPMANWNVDRGWRHFGIWHGIYKKTPFLMVTFFVVGLGAAIGHHSFYMWLDGKQVGTQGQQEWNLRFGSAFAYLTQITLVASVGIAYTQWLWRTLSTTALSVECLDAAFDADMAVVSLFNMEFLNKVTLGASLALLCWFLQIPSLITPATLNVKPTLKVETQMANVSALSIEDSQWKRYAISFNTSDNVGLLFAGPRTVIQRLVTATATEGIILPIRPPFTNSTYALDIVGPAVRCGEASPEIAREINRLRDEAVQKHIASIKPKENRYYGFVPAFPNGGNVSGPYDSVTAIDTKRLQEPIDGSNQLWMVYSVYQQGFDDVNVWDRPTVDQYTVCKLYRASYHLNFTFQESIQKVSIVKEELMDEVLYPRLEEPQTDLTRMRHAYSAIMWAISDILIGKIGTFQTADTSFGGRTQFSEISTQIAHTSLLGSSDLRPFFDKNRDRGLLPSDQTKEDIRLAAGRTLAVLIQELAFNVTISFMNSPLLSPNIMTETVREQSIITYDYSSRNLLILYSIAVTLALVANALGAVAFLRNDASHTRTFSARVITTRGKKFNEFVESQGERGLSAPLVDNIMNMKIKFDALEWRFIRVAVDGDEEDIVEPEQQRNKLRKSRTREHSVEIVEPAIELDEMS